jgi:hypothetical protein
LSGSFLNGGAIALSGAGSATAFELNNAVISGGKAQTIGAGAAIESMSGASDTLKGVAILASSLIEVASPARWRLAAAWSVRNRSCPQPAYFAAVCRSIPRAMA